MNNSKYTHVINIKINCDIPNIDNIISNSLEECLNQYNFKCLTLESNTYESDFYNNEEKNKDSVNNKKILVKKWGRCPHCGHLHKAPPLRCEPGLFDNKTRICSKCRKSF